MTNGGTIVEVALDAHLVGQRLDRALADALPALSRERIKALVQAGAVVDSGGRAWTTASAKLDAPTAFAITVPALTELNAEPQELPLQIVHEDEHLIVVDKPAGLVVHPANGNPDGTLVNALLHHCAGRLSGIGGVLRPGIVHRIDKDTSGLLVVAKSDVAHEGLSRQFADHSIDRAYCAIVTGLPVPPTGAIDAAIARSPTDRKKMAVVRDDARRGKRAVTHYRLREALREAALLECRLETGRTHQVRVHLTHIGHPLLGDPVYGRAQSRHAQTLKSIGFARQALHAARLGFIHPVTTESLRFESALPADMQELLSLLRV